MNLSPQFQQLTMFEPVGDLTANADISGEYNALALHALNGRGDREYTPEKFWKDKLTAAQQPNLDAREVTRISGKRMPVFKKTPNVAERVEAHGGVDHPISLGHTETGKKTIVDGYHRLAVMAERDRQSGSDSLVPVQWGESPHDVHDLEYDEWTQHGLPTNEERKQGLSAILTPDYESASKFQTYQPKTAKRR